MPCSSCRFYEPKHSQCRRHAPTTLYDGYGLKHGWPTVMAYHGCGEYSNGASIVKDGGVKEDIAGHVEKRLREHLSFEQSIAAPAPTTAELVMQAIETSKSGSVSEW